LYQKIKANQVGAARVLLDITQIQLAELSGISPSTVKRIEAGLGVTKANHAAVVAALEKAGVEFIDGDEPGVKLRAKGKRK
jgi:transcriptional regulator with XRE-family HTH domain